MKPEPPHVLIWEVRILSSVRVTANQIWDSSQTWEKEQVIKTYHCGRSNRRRRWGTSWCICPHQRKLWRSTRISETPCRLLVCSWGAASLLRPGTWALPPSSRSDTLTAHYTRHILPAVPAAVKQEKFWEGCCTFRTQSLHLLPVIVDLHSFIVKLNVERLNMQNQHVLNLISSKPLVFKNYVVFVFLPSQLI